MLQTFLADRTSNYKPTNLEDYNKEIDEALEEALAGNYIPRERWKTRPLSGKKSKVAHPVSKAIRKSISIYTEGFVSKC